MPREKVLAFSWNSRVILPVASGDVKHFQVRRGELLFNNDGRTQHGGKKKALKGQVFEGL